MPRSIKTTTAQSAPLLAGIAEPAPDAKPVVPVDPPRARARAKPKPETNNAVAIRDPNVPPPSRPTLLQVCIEAASRPDTSPDKVKAYLDMAHAEEERVLEREFDNLMIDARADMPVIVRDAWNPHTKSHYAKLEKVSQQIDGIARKYGFQHSYGMADAKLDNHYRVICDLINRNGFKRRYYIEIGSDTVGARGGGTKSGAQGSGSSVSYARRYLKFMIWDLVLAGSDSDAQPQKSGDTIESSQMQELKDLIRETNTVEAQFCDHFGIEGLSELSQADFKKARGMLIRKKEGQR